MRRPSYKELEKKIREARRAVREGRVFILEQEAVAVDAIELGYLVETELPEVLREILDETGPGHYAGTRPPQRSYEREIEGLELLSFALASARFGCRVYCKFALTQEAFWLVSLHRERKGKRKSS
jgi:hypothetical protein